jgi:hypothetical protein
MLGYREGRKPYAHDRSGKQATCRVTVSVAAAPRAPGTEAVALCAQAPCGRLGPPGRRPAISAATEPRHAECPIHAPQQMIAKGPLVAHSGGDARVSGVDRCSPSVRAAAECLRAECQRSARGVGCGRGALGRAERLVLAGHSDVLRILRITGRWGWRRATTWKPCRAKVDATPGNRLRVWPGTVVSTG